MSRRTLRAQTVPVGELAAETREAMWGLFERYYDDVDRARFMSDLSRKRDVVLLTVPSDGSVQGFCNLQVYPGTAAGRPYVAVFTGDTVIDPATCYAARSLFVATENLSTRGVALQYFFRHGVGYRTQAVIRPWNNRLRFRQRRWVWRKTHLYARIIFIQTLKFSDETIGLLSR